MRSVGRAVEPLEDQLVDELRQAQRIPVDETAWCPGRIHYLTSVGFWRD
jgi:hypothetical protein